jgi:hypothetical protein
MMTSEREIFRHTRPDFGAAALITIDVQRDFLDDAPCQIPGTTATLPRLRALVGAFLDAARPLVHVVRIYEGDGSNVDLCRRVTVEAGASIVGAGTPGVEPSRFCATARRRLTFRFSCPVRCSSSEPRNGPCTNPVGLGCVLPHKT